MKTKAKNELKTKLDKAAVEEKIQKQKVLKEQKMALEMEKKENEERA